jgi:ADP-ribose pyrophosphatase YjhB (NUDIX family)
MSELQPRELTPGVIERRAGNDVTRRRILHDEFMMQLVEDCVNRPDGTTGIQYWFKFSTRPVMTLPMRDGMLYLLSGDMYGVGGKRIEASDGPMREGETPEQAAYRITRDEIGVEIDMLHQLHEGLEEITGRAENRTYIYLARANRILSAEEAPEAARARIEVPFPEALEMLRRKEIVNGIVRASIWDINDLLTSQEEATYEDLRFKNP